MRIARRILLQTQHSAALRTVLSTGGFTRSGHACRHHQRHMFSSPPSSSSPSSSATAPSTDSPTIKQEATPTAATTERNEEQQQEQKFKPVQEIAFPWREAPRQDLSFFDSLYKTMNEFMPQAYIRSLFFNAVGNLMETAPEDLPEMLMRTTRFAFIQAVRSILEGKCQVPPPTWEYTADEDKISDQHALGYPALADIMDEKLVQLYEHVAQRFQANKRQVKLELASIVPVGIDDLKLIIGPPRGVSLPGVTRHERLGVTVIAKPMTEEPVDWGSSFLKQIRPTLVQEYHYLFQIGVTFRCRELFVVTNEETNEIVQGTDAYVDTQHTVRFEIDFDKNARLAKDWQIIDIDGFLDGNPYMPEVNMEGGGASTAAGGGREEKGKDE